MKTALRLLLSLFFFVSIVLTIHLFAWKTLISNTDKVKEILRDGNVYAYMATQLTEKLHNQEDDSDVSITITGPQVAAIADPLVDQSILYVTGKSTVPPSFSLDKVISQFMGQDPKLAQELKAMQAEMVKEMRERNDKEAAEITKTMESIPSTIVFDKQLEPVKKLYEVMQYLPSIFLGLSAIHLIFIILLGNSAKQRISWIAGISFITAFILGIGIGIVSIIPRTISVNANVNGKQAAELIEVVIPLFITPVLATLKQYHVVGLAISVMIGLIAVCARFMLFSQAVLPITPIKKKKI